jgi:hypothetical protein
VRATLIKDNQLPDRSFKGLAVGVLSKLGEKIAGEAGKEAADAIVGRRQGLWRRRLSAF